MQWQQKWEIQLQNGLITINILDRYHNGMHIEIDAGIVMTFDKSGT